MLAQIDIATAQGSLLSLPVDDTSNGYVVQMVDGMDPVKANLSSTSFAGLDGEQYQSSRRGTRNIKFKLGLMPNPLVDSVRDLRKRLYGYLMPKSEVLLTFYMEDGLTVSIAGVVESFETTIFDQEPTVDISVICYDPDFYVPAPEVLSGTSTESTAISIVDYDGEVETGFVFTLNVNRAMSGVTLYHTDPSNKIRTLDYSGSLVSGDVLKISTVTGDKGATLTHLGTASSVLYGVSPESTWLNLMPGLNKLRVYAPGAGVPYSITYTTRYGGL